MLGAPVVPKGDGIRAPSKAALKQRILPVLVQIAENPVALVDGDAQDTGCESTIDVERPSSSLGVAAHNRMLGSRLGCPIWLARRGE